MCQLITVYTCRCVLVYNPSPVLNSHVSLVNYYYVSRSDEFAKLLLGGSLCETKSLKVRGRCGHVRGKVFSEGVLTVYVVGLRWKKISIVTNIPYLTRLKMGILWDYK